MFPISLHTTARSREQPYLSHKVCLKYFISLAFYFSKFLLGQSKNRRVLPYLQHSTFKKSISICPRRFSLSHPDEVLSLVPTTFHFSFELKKRGYDYKVKITHSVDEDDLYKKLK